MPKPVAQKTTPNNGSSKAKHPVKPQQLDPSPPDNTGNQENVPPGMAKAAQSEGVRDTQQQATDSLVDSANGPNNGENAVNRKKQKRRQKQAARLAAEQPQSHHPRSVQGHLENSNLHYQNSTYAQDAAQTSIPPNGYDYGTSGFDDQEEYEPGEGEDLYYTDEEGRLYPGPYVPAQTPANGHLANEHGLPGSSNSKAKKKKKINPSRSTSQHKYQSAYSTGNTLPFSPPLGLQPPPPPPPPPPSSLSTAALHSARTISKDRIWNTSTAEERERIKEFWLSLGEEERRSLVKVEKEAVLKKMKEQQKHSCSCTVCGRKRTAIEEELEVLYDAYYEELEQYANHQQTTLDDGTPMMPPPRMYTHPMARMPPARIPPLLNSQRASRGRIQDLPEGDDDGDEEDYSDEDDDDDSSDEELEEEPRGPAADFFNFGNSLTVQGGILTVADDLLKNDGKKFIEMMEQLAERRMQREEEAQYAAAGLGHPSMQGHNHGPPLDDEDYDDDDDEEYDSQEDDEYEEDEMETMTEEQRMEEGRRMFQIFAARMFEQRVLTAYREKVAAERQQKLIEELEEESRLDTQREAKKAKEAQKKKDKKRLQKQAKEEEKAKRDAEKAAEEAVARAIEEQKLEEQRQKKEEQRRKKEAEKRVQDEDRQKKEAEKQKRLQETREQQAEQERKQREQKEREKKKREEVKRKEREDVEVKEREAKERKEREAVEKREKEVKSRAEKEAKDRAKKEEHTPIHTAQLASTVSQPLKRTTNVSALPLPPGIHNPPSNHASPHLQIATPVIPKAPTPGRARQTSFQDSHSSSPKVPQAPSGSSTTSPSVSTLHQHDIAPASFPGKLTGHPPPLHHPQPTSTIPPMNTPLAMTAQPFSGFPGMPAMAGNGYPSSHGPLMPGMVQRAPFGHETPIFPPQHPSAGPHYRGFMAPNAVAFPPGVTPIRQLPQGRGVPIDPLNTQTHQPPNSTPNANTPVQYGMPRDTMPSHSHSRQASASFDMSPFETATFPAQSQPIARPAPIQRPSSVKPNNSEIDDLSNHLGSSALLDGTDLPLSSSLDDGRRGSMAPGSARHGFGASPLFSEHIGSAKLDSFPRGVPAAMGNSWGTPPMPFGNPALSGPPTWSTAPGTGWPTNNAFGIIGGPNRLSASRPVTIRLLVTQACKQLTANNLTKSDNGFHNVDAVLRQVEQLKPANEGPIQLKEMLDICDTEGNAQNGGGSFTVRAEGSRGTFVKFEADDIVPMNGRGGAAPGEIGSPIVGSSMPAFGVARPFQPPGLGISSSSGS